MIYIAQVISVHPDRQGEFDDFESIAIEALTRYNGRMLIRYRPAVGKVIIANMDLPTDIHFVAFENETDFRAFLNDEHGKAVIH